MNKDIKKIQIILFCIIIIWLSGSIIFSLLGLFDQPGTPPTYFGLFLTGPLIFFLLVYFFSRRVREALYALPLWLITAIHILRFVGIGFVAGVLTDDLPSQFGWPSGIGDIAAAIFSIPITIRLYRNCLSKGLRIGFIVWNIFGLIDLFSAITLGLLYSVSVVGILSSPFSNTRSLSFFPVSLIPTFYVPILILLHFLALKRSGEIAKSQNVK